MPRTIAIANQKGGSGKTTTAANLGAALAELGQRVLLIDMDPQGNLTTYLGLEVEDLPRTVYNSLVERVDLNDVLQRGVLPNVDLVPANIDLCAAEIQLVAEMGREKVLSQRLKSIKDDYDFILIDCSPSLGILVVNALTAADEVIVPLQCSFLALRGLGMLVETIEKVSGRINAGVHLSGIVLTMHDPRTLHSREVEELTRKRFPDLVYQTVIHRSVRFDEAPVEGQPITTYAGGATKGAVEYRALAQEVLHGKGTHETTVGSAR